MNYRHAFHAGNFADVMKHIILVLTIEHLKKKSKPFRVIDTHAGCGLYDLRNDEAQRTLEWQDGIGRLVAARDKEAWIAQFDALNSYLGILDTLNSDGDIQFYPGSPLIAEKLLRDSDRMIANELHPEDVEILRNNFARNKKVKVMNLDGWTFLKSVLPPPERRGLVLVDPPFEQPGEFERMVQGLMAAVKRFATGIYLFWYPLKHLKEVARFKNNLRDSNIKRLLAVEVWVAPHDPGSGLTGTGMVIHNAPFGLQEELSNLLPNLTKLLSTHADAHFEIDVIAGE